MQIFGNPTPSPEGAALPFSQAVSSGHLVFLSGQVPLHHGGLVSTLFTVQAQCVFDNVEAQLNLAGCTLANVVKVTAWLTEQENFAAFNEVYRERFDGHLPARSTVISALALPGALIEIEVVAERPDSV